MKEDDFSKKFNGEKVYIHTDENTVQFLKKQALSKGYNKINILDMRHHLGCFVFIAEKIDSSEIQIHSNLYEDLSFFQKMKRIFKGNIKNEKRM